MFVQRIEPCLQAQQFGSMLFCVNDSKRWQRTGVRPRGELRTGVPQLWKPSDRLGGAAGPSFRAVEELVPVSQPDAAAGVRQGRRDWACRGAGVVERLPAPVHEVALAPVRDRPLVSPLLAGRGVRRGETRLERPQVPRAPTKPLSPIASFAARTCKRLALRPGRRICSSPSVTSPPTS